MSRHRTLIRLSAVLAAVAWAKGCGDGDSPTEPPPRPEPERPTTVTVSPTDAQLTALGETVQLTAEVHDQNARVMANVTVTWSSSADSVATVSASGLVTGIAEGMATITATVGEASGTSEITVEDPDRAALVALYNATDGPNWVNSENWLTDAPLGEWYGVQTNASGRVVQLNLGGRWDHETQAWIPHGLIGPIPGELGGLVELRQLDLGSNRLTGPIPGELGNLARLVRLYLHRNALTGPIPVELGGLVELRQLDLGSNRLTGPIPGELGRLASLEGLYLAANELVGPIPVELGGLVELRQLGLGSNRLTGPIPGELGRLASLEGLYLVANELVGPIPQTFLQLDRLDRFYIEGNDGLCVPGSSPFVAWLRGIERRDDDSESRFCNAADAAVLGQLYELAGGTGWTRSDGWAGDGALEERYGVSADSLGRVTALDLTANGLDGTLPPALGHLDRMAELRIADNPDLSGRLPLSLANLSLRTLHYAGTGLCSPAETSFRDWLNAIASHEGTDAECTPLSDREILEAFYHSTGGPDWTNSENWLTDAPLDEWHGVRADGQGQVLSLYIGANNLTGRLPPELGMLTNLRGLNLGVNGLEGPIPPELGGLTNLVYLTLDFTNLSGSIPSELGGLTNLNYLNLWGNRLSGPIPPELGGLANLWFLYLNENDLSGTIPPELGDLANARSLNLPYNRLTGPIPPELGRLASVEKISLLGNELTGPIPAEFGELAALEILWLGDNGLEGPIPPEFGELAALEILWLGDNGLEGPIPPELGSLGTLEQLRLENNNLEGPLPPEFGSMSNLRELVVSNNPEMEGALPLDLTALTRLEALLAVATGLCVPPHPGVQTWLNGVHKRRIKACAVGDPPMAYLTQAVQSREFPVPLVAGEKALLRVFPTANQVNSAGIPAVRARFFVDGRETHVEDVARKPGSIPTEVDEGSLSKSANAEIPPEVIRPGLEMVVEVDPEGTLDPALGVSGRIPETGRLEVDVRAMPVFDLTLIPFLWAPAPDSSIVETIGNMAADPNGHEELWQTRTLLPVGDLSVTAHEPVVSTSNRAYDLLRQTEAIRAVEGGTGYYMGMMLRETLAAGPSGIGPIGRRYSFSTLGPIAHELGHNMNLFHAPCGRAGGPDPSFPYPDGSIGAWGYDFRGGGRLVSFADLDLMSYCSPRWISDYSFTNALRYRLFDEGPGTASAKAVPAKSLLLWGGTDAAGAPFLEPAFVIDAPPALPDSAGAYRLVGQTASGGTLFSLSFTMPEIAHGDGRSSFAFVLPVRNGWEGNLANITLTGPGGSFTLDGDSDRPMAILRDPRTGQVREFLDDLPAPAQAAMGAAGQVSGTELEVLFSRGIPDANPWWR